MTQAQFSVVAPESFDAGMIKAGGFRAQFRNTPAARETANKMVSALNAHDDLVKALTWAMEQIPGYTKRIPRQNEDWCDAYDAAKAALAKAAS
jgi:hypothetical protein